MKPESPGEQKQPFAILMVRWMIRLAVASMVLALVIGILQRISNSPLDTSRAPDEEVVRLKGRVAQLELELEQAREEIGRLKKERASGHEEPTN